MSFLRKKENVKWANMISFVGLCSVLGFVQAQTIQN